MSSTSWTFQQIEGQGDRKRLELSGWSAPFGRPRKDPIFTEVIKSRVQTTYYPGKSGKPTRHSFGTNTEPIELKGRWMTPQLIQDGIAGANVMADLWKKFVQDQRQCRMSWGYILSYEVFIEELHLARESADQIAWKMKIHIDKSDDALNKKGLNRAKNDTNALEAELTRFRLTQVYPTISRADLAPDFLDQLDNLAATLNEPAAALNRLVGQVSDIEKATYSTLQHFRSAVSGFEQAIIAFQELILSTTIDSAVLVRSAEADIAWVKFQLDLDAQTTGILGFLSRADRAAELQARSEVGKLLEAKDGDTWESVSTRATGSPGRAGEIRAMNGAHYGERPQAGETYLVP